MTESEATGVRAVPGTSRRRMLQGRAVGAGDLWVAPAIDSFVTPAAELSGHATDSQDARNGGWSAE